MYTIPLMVALVDYPSKTRRHKRSFILSVCDSPVSFSFSTQECRYKWNNPYVQQSSQAQIHGRGIQTLPVVCTLLYCVAYGVLRLFRTQLITGRSEEHTSELQSHV